MRPSRSTRPREGAPVRAALAWALAGFGALCVALTGAGLALGARPLVVRTGSMAPGLPVGTVVLVRPEPAGHAAVGQVVAVVRADGRRILHRVRRTRPAGDGAITLVLRGDRNHSADPPVTVQRVERPVLAVPAIGRPVMWLGGRWVQFWLGVATGMLAIAWLASRQRRRASREAERAAARSGASRPREALRA